MTNGFSDMHCTVLFPFTLAGRKLGLVFIFHAERGKRLQKEATGSWQEELLPPQRAGQLQQRAYFFCNKAGFMDATIYADVIWTLHRELMDARGEDPKNYPRTHLLHDRATGHIENHMNEVFESVNMGATMVKLTSKLQILDVGIGRNVRAGYLAEQTLHYHSHELKVGDLTFHKLKETSKKGAPRYEGPFRVLKLEQLHTEGGDSCVVTLGRGGSEKIVVDLDNTRRNVISKNAYRKLAVVFLCNVWYLHVDKELIKKIAVRTGEMTKWDGSDDHNVRVFVGQYRVPFGPVRKKVLHDEEHGSAGSTLSLSRAADDKLFKAAKEKIIKAAAVRREDKAQKGKLVLGSIKRKRKKEKPSSSQSSSGSEEDDPVPPTKRRRGRPSKKSTKETTDGAAGEKLKESDEKELDGDDSEDWAEFFTGQQAALYQVENKVDLHNVLSEGEMVVIAGHPECGDTQPFYVGVVVEPRTTLDDTDQKSRRIFTLQFYNNFKQDLYGTYQPAWLDLECRPHPKEDYGRHKPGYAPLESWAEVDWILARGFKLQIKSQHLFRS
jgi:hypothetical protein